MTDSNSAPSDTLSAFCKENNIPDDKIETVRDFVETYALKQHQELMNEVSSINNLIIEAKKRIVASMPEEFSMDASLELDAVVKSAENATHSILNESERIQELIKEHNDDELSSTVNKSIMRIFEACNFEDLASQRITKVLQMIKMVEGRIGTLVATSPFTDKQPEEITCDDDLMNGPQLEEAAPSQEDIDKLFDDM